MERWSSTVRLNRAVGFLAPSAVSCTWIDQDIPPCWFMYRQSTLKDTDGAVLRERPRAVPLQKVVDLERC